MRERINNSEWIWRFDVVYLRPIPFFSHHLNSRTGVDHPLSESKSSAEVVTRLVGLRQIPDVHGEKVYDEMKYTVPLSPLPPSTGRAHQPLANRALSDPAHISCTVSSPSHSPHHLIHHITASPHSPHHLIHHITSFTTSPPSHMRPMTRSRLRETGLRAPQREVVRADPIR